MKRRRAGEGSFLFDEKRQLYRYSQWYTDPITGVHKRKELRAKTRQLLDQKVRAWKKEQAEGIVPINNMTVEKWCEEYLNMASPSLKQLTLTNYRQTINTQILPVLGSIKLSALSPFIVQRWINGLVKKGYTAQTIVNYRRVLSLILNTAVKMRLLSFNPVPVTKPPRVEKKLPTVLSREEINRLLILARSCSFLPPAGDIVEQYHRHCFYTALLMSLAAGLRYGECFSLHWTDCVRNGIYIRHNLIKGRVTESPKTTSSVRFVQLPDNVWKELMEWRKFQTIYLETDGLVFSSPKGRPVQRNKFFDWWQALRKAAELPESYRWHHNRATMATQLLAAGIPLKTVAQRLGHSSVTMTLNKYAGLLESADSKAIAVLQDVVKLPEKNES